MGGGGREEAKGGGMRKRRNESLEELYGDHTYTGPGSIWEHLSGERGGSGKECPMDSPLFIHGPSSLFPSARHCRTPAPIKVWAVPPSCQHFGDPAGLQRPERPCSSRLSDEVTMPL